MAKRAKNPTKAQIKILNILADELESYCEYMSDNTEYDEFETFFIRQGHDVDRRSKSTLLEDGLIEDFDDETLWNMRCQRITRKGAKIINSNLFG